MGLSARGEARQKQAAWTAGEGNLRRISSAPARPPLPAPHLKMLYRHPSLGRDSVYIVLVWECCQEAIYALAVPVARTVPPGVSTRTRRTAVDGTWHFNFTGQFRVTKTMATDKKTKSDPAPKAEAAAKKDAPAKATEPTKDKAVSTEAAAPESGDKAAAPKSYSRGEGQKAVTQAYKDNWNAIYGKKSPTKTKKVAKKSVKKSAKKSAMKAIRKTAKKKKKK